MKLQETILHIFMGVIVFASAVVVAMLSLIDVFISCELFFGSIVLTAFWWIQFDHLKS